MQNIEIVCYLQHNTKKLEVRTCWKKNGLNIRNHYEKRLQYDDFFFLGLEKVFKVQTGVVLQVSGTSEVALKICIIWDITFSKV